MAYQYGMGLSEEERIMKNVRDLLELNKGSVPYDRGRGVTTAWEHKRPGRYTAGMLTDAADMVNSRETRATVQLKATENGFNAKVALND